MKKTSTNLAIAKAIIAAQTASDAGKGICEIDGRCARHGRHDKYGCKPAYIVKAIETIRTSSSDFRYYVAETGDQNGYPSIIAYFEFKLDNERYQVSFHTPANRAGVLEKYANTGRKTRWDRIFGGSRRACLKLMDYFGIH
jgi:hypothetical protein